MVNKNKPLETLKEEVRLDILNTTKSKKVEFTYYDAVKVKSNGTERSKVIMEAIEYLNSNPLNENDYYKYLNAYSKNKVRLNEKYFRHDLSKLEKYYKVADQREGNNPFSKTNYDNYVLFMFLKLYGHYLESDDELFNVKIVDNREYNPLTKIPSVLRGCLPFEVKEYDIKRAFPTFIDIELDSEFRHSVYEEIEKSNFAMFLNSNSESKVSIEDARKGLFPIYKKRVNEVLTEERYNERGKLFKDLTKYEKQYIDRFISENNLVNFVRLHDGIFLLKDVECKITEFETVHFSIKESIKPKIESNILSFYAINKFGEVETSPSMYADFLEQEKFIRISTPDDKILLLKNSNNVIDYFNHKTDMVSFLNSEINEGCDKSVRNKTARDNNTTLMQSYTLLKPIDLIYYKDTKERFGLSFKNGFFYFDDKEKFEIKSKCYKEVNGFFTPHPIQKREFSYTDEVGNFELLIQRITTGFKTYDKENKELQTIVNSFNSMIGYLCHNYKSYDSPCIVLTDEGANDENRDGGRFKSGTFIAISNVTKTLVKGGAEFDPNYTFNYDDLDKSHNLYVIDDVPYNFNYNALYTNLSGGINAHKKGCKADMIEKEDSPKFLITTNYLFRCDDKDTSTKRRFYEYKIKPYYNINYTPKDEFKQTFFEDWDNAEWNKFYSYIFRCVRYYLVNGLERIKYDKTEDNFKALFNSDAKLSEMERIIDVLINHRRQTTFSVGEFLSVYQSVENPLRNEKLFSSKNAKKLISQYIINSIHKDFIYSNRIKRWEKR